MPDGSAFDGVTRSPGQRVPVARISGSVLVVIPVVDIVEALHACFMKVEFPAA